MAFENYLRKLKGTTIKVALAFIIISAIITGIFAFDLWGSTTFLKDIILEIQNVFSEFADGYGNIQLVPLLLNNIKVCFVAFGVGVVPFLYLPALILVVNALIIGAVLGLFALESVGMMFITIGLGILPHGIFELPAIFISIACGFTLCSTITKAVLKKEQDMNISEVILYSLQTIIFICVPLMTVAGIIEVYATPKLLMMFI